MKALTVWQPWAWLIVHGHKDVENRKWKRKPSESLYGTRILIHAGKRKITKDDWAEFLQTVKDRKIKKYPKTPDDFDYGALIGSVRLVKVVRGFNSYWAAPGHDHWVLSDARRLRPVKFKGNRKLFDVKMR